MRACLMIMSLLLSAAPELAGAQGLQGARDFVVRLYGRYAQGAPDYAGKDAPKAFSPDLVRLIRRDQTRTPQGDVGALDGDPICDCQDPGGLRLVALDVGASGRTGAQALARIRFGREPVIAVRLDLVWTASGWRVADVHTKDMPSLVALLERPGG
jgi:hypothetical protein